MLNFSTTRIKIPKYCFSIRCSKKTKSDRKSTFFQVFAEKHNLNPRFTLFVLSKLLSDFDTYEIKTFRFVLCIYGSCKIRFLFTCQSVGKWSREPENNTKVLPFLCSLSRPPPVVTGGGRLKPHRNGKTMEIISTVNL